VERVCQLSKDRHETLRLRACSCLANVAHAHSPPSPRQQELAAIALPVAVKLVGEREVGAVQCRPQPIKSLKSMK
jgi:hypothetical protein